MNFLKYRFNFLMKYSGASWNIFFVLSLILVSYYYEYHKIINLRPQSIHCWRQSDCASIALNYYQNGMNLFKPEVHNLKSDNYTSGFCVGECPVYYYFIASLYTVFGPHEYIYRFMNILIFFIGLFALFKLLQNLLQDSFWAFSISLLFFTSPVVVYYVNNFITDPIALSFVFCGWYFFLKYYQTRKTVSFYVSLLFFLIAALLKITAAMSIVVLVTLYFIEALKLYKFRKSSFIFHSRVSCLLSFILYAAIIAGWYLLGIYYNQNHGSNYFLMETRPLWNLSSEIIDGIIDAVLTSWRYEYFNIWVLIFFLIAFVVIVLFSKKQNPLLYVIALLFFIGSVVYSILFFDAFKDHDYYIIILLVLPLSILIVFFDYLKRFKTVYKSFFVKFLFLCFIIYNIEYAREKLDWRYHSWVNNYPQYEDLSGINPYLRSIGIEKTDIVISLPDATPCYTLYLMNQVGFTGWWVNRDSTEMTQSIERGAKYLILSGDPPGFEYLETFKRNKIGDYKSVSIFKLE